MLKLGIDIDDTITDTTNFILEKAEYFDKNYLSNKGFKNKEAFDFTEMFYWKVDDKSKFFDYLKENRFLENVNIRKDFIDVYEDIIKKCKLYFITARSSRAFIDSEKQTKDYLEKYNIKYEKLYANIKNKEEICVKEKIDLFVDDNINNCEKVKEKGINIIHMKSKYNNNSDLFTLNNWYEINEYIDTLIHKKSK